MGRLTSAANVRTAAKSLGACSSPSGLFVGLLGLAFDLRKALLANGIHVVGKKCLQHF